MPSEKEAKATRSALETASTPPPKALFSTLITANHILHYHQVVDAYGPHFRPESSESQNILPKQLMVLPNPENPDRSRIPVQDVEQEKNANFQALQVFNLSRSLAPALVSKREDLEEYYLEDASPVQEGEGPKRYAERFIHSEVYKKYQGVNSVVHSHSQAVIPFGISSIPLRPVFHMGGVVGHQVPVYDIANHYTTSDQLHSLLVTNQHLGAGLAAGFNPSSTISKGLSTIKNYLTSSSPSEVDFPPSPTVLMRGHGMTVVGSTIEEAVYRSIYTCTNARVQTTALLMKGGYNLSHIAKRMGQGGGEKGENPGPAKQEGIHFLNERESRDAWTQNQGHAERPWKLWCREVGEMGLYVNELGDPPGA